jgi:hypothetical protein
MLSRVNVRPRSSTPNSLIKRTVVNNYSDPVLKGRIESGPGIEETGANQLGCSLRAVKTEVGQ